MSEHLQLKDHSSESRIFAARVWVVSVFVFVMVGVLIVRYHNLQVVHHQDYATQSDRNRIHVQPIPPTRGLIYDRNGVLLADNRASYTLSITREMVKDLPATLELLSSIVDISPGDLEKFQENLKQRRRPFETVPLRYQLTEDEIARLAVNEYRLEGVEVEAQLVRHYPFAELFAHSIGYVGRISERELRNFSEDEYERYQGTYSIGKIGLERQYEDLLLGQVGYQNVETNARGRVLKELERDDPTPGRDLHLYLDVEIQQAAMDALGEQRGAVVALDVRTGGVLAIASTPSFDPNLFVTGISHKDYKTLNESLDTPLFDRALRGQYAAGSTLKPMLGLAGLHHGHIKPGHTISDPGYFQLPNDTRRYRDHISWGHGKAVDLRESIVESCNTFYYDLAHRMTIDLIHPFGSHFGLGQRTGIDLPGERPGIWPSRRWKKETRGFVWYPGDTLNVGVGQGFVLVTPLQLAVMSATLASRGERREPRLARDLAAADGDTNSPVDRIEVAEKHWDYIADSMEAVVHDPRGTARSINKDLSYRMAAKTGTAQVIGIAQGEKYDAELIEKRYQDQALFIGFAPVDDPQIAVGIIVENGGHGGESAAPVARAVIDSYFASERRREAKFTRQDG
ncbi:penicillin-binding protein 2 [Gilvimarinus sp. F26214L]|uniref:penicillin-binding protein 2 n=1 Tax=Gilvimarinus sp. DZF01 TaxID=3461371 RepID=UPI00404604F4